MTSYLALQGEEPQSMLGRVASLGGGVASSLGKLLNPQPRTEPAPRGELHRQQSLSAAQVLHMALSAVKHMLTQRPQRSWLCMPHCKCWRIWTNATH